MDKNEQNALMLWKLGLGNMGKLFNGEDPMPKKDVVATGRMFEGKEKMPTTEDDFSVIEVPIVVPAYAMDILKKGHIPECQEDHWFMYCTRNMLRYYRSWTGMCAYECHFKRLNDELYIIDKITVNRNLCQWGVNGEFAALLLLHYLIAAETGGNWPAAWEAFCNLRYPFPIGPEGRETPEPEDEEQEEDDEWKSWPTGMELKDKMRGCLIGGAVGDALGYEVEFMKWYQIEKRYGKRGIRRYDSHGAPQFHAVARISDDTQMTIFTAGGLLKAMTRNTFENLPATNVADCVKEAYIDWYNGQTGYGRKRNMWFSSEDFLNSQRAPGNTCLTALQNLKNGEKVTIFSKGCGGVMRTAPVALYFAGLRDRAKKGEFSDFDESIVAAELAWLTHRHPGGWWPAFALNLMLDILLRGGDMEDAVGSTISYLRDYTAHKPEFYEDDGKCNGFEEGLKLSDLLKKAYQLGKDNVKKAEAYEQLGEGWTGDEALAIAVYCAIRYSDPKHIRTRYLKEATYATDIKKRQFEEAVCCAVNHSGDSDSTGSICGQLMGAWLGYHCIPGYYTGAMSYVDPLFKDNDEYIRLESHDLLMALAEDLYRGCPFESMPHPLEIETKEQKQWYLRYVLNEDCDSTNAEARWARR